MSEKRAAHADVAFGAFADPLTKQLRGVLPHIRLRGFDRLAGAITFLAVHGYITDKEKDRARRRLLSVIAREAKAFAKSKRSAS